MTQVPPDDDPRFAQWLKSVGPPREMPPADQTDPPLSLTAGIVLIAAIAGMAVAIGFAWALVFAAVSVGVALWISVGGIAVAGICIAYLVRQAT